MPTPSKALASFREAVRLHKAGQSRVRARVPTVAEYVFRTLDGPYRERVATGAMSASTWTIYEQIYRLNIEPDVLGQIPIDDVRPSDIEEWVSSLRTQPRTLKDETVVPARPMSANSKLRYVGMLSGIFERARKVDRLIEHNPVRDADKPKQRETKFRILSGEEIARLIARAREYADERLKSHPRHELRPLLIVLLGLHGLGPSEMCGLRKEDFDGQGFHVSRQSRRGRVIERLKTRRRADWVAASEELLELVAKMPDGYLLGGKNGRPMGETNLRRLFSALTLGTEFQGMTPYDLRHTFAMLLLERGVDVRTAAELMRHSPEMLVNRYAKSRRDLKVQALGKLKLTQEPTQDRRSGGEIEPKSGDSAQTS